MYTYLLTPWNRVLEKLTGFHLVKNFPAFYGASRSINAFTSAVYIFCTKIRFYGEELIAPLPTLSLEDHPLLAVGDCFFNICAATLHTGGRFSIRNLRMRYAVVTGTHLSRGEDVHVY